MCNHHHGSHFRLNCVLHVLIRWVRDHINRRLSMKIHCFFPNPEPFNILITYFLSITFKIILAASWSSELPFFKRLSHKSYVGSSLIEALLQSWYNVYRLQSMVTDAGSCCLALCLREQLAFKTTVLN
jgi:hypothetical protein